MARLPPSHTYLHLVRPSWRQLTSFEARAALWGVRAVEATAEGGARPTPAGRGVGLIEGCSRPSGPGHAGGSVGTVGAASTAGPSPRLVTAAAFRPKSAEGESTPVRAQASHRDPRTARDSPDACPRRPHGHDVVHALRGFLIGHEDETRRLHPMSALVGVTVGLHGTQH